MKVEEDHASLNFPISILVAQVIGSTVLAQSVRPFTCTAEFEVFARPRNIVVDHVD